MLQVGLEMKLPRSACAWRRISSFMRVKICCCPALSHEMRICPSGSVQGASNRMVPRALSCPITRYSME